MVNVKKSCRLLSLTPPSQDKASSSRVDALMGSKSDLKVCAFGFFICVFFVKPALIDEFLRITKINLKNRFSCY